MQRSVPVRRGKSCFGVAVKARWSWIVVALRDEVCRGSRVKEWNGTMSRVLFFQVMVGRVLAVEECHGQARFVPALYG